MYWPYPGSSGRPWPAGPRGEHPGAPIDGKGPLENDGFSAVEAIAPGVIERQSVDQPVQTGYKSVDAMIPIGRGQRELIIGDRQTGKTALAIDAIINQRDSGIKCVYVAIGQKASTISNVVRKLEEHGALANTIVVVATASESAALQYGAIRWLRNGRILPRPR